MTAAFSELKVHTSFGADIGEYLLRSSCMAATI